MPAYRKPLLQMTVWTALCIVLIVLCIALVDRPVSTWVHAHLGDGQLTLFTATYDGHPLAIGPFTLLAMPAEATSRAAPFVVALSFVAAAAGWRPQRRARVLIACCATIVVALQINQQLKWVLGRTWPESWRGDNLSWIRDGAYGFSPLHGGSDRSSFPSGHTTVAAASATLLWLILPQGRAIWAAYVAIVAVGLVGGNHHFVSDVVAGLYVGVVIAIGATRVMPLRPGCLAVSTDQAALREGGAS